MSGQRISSDLALNPAQGVHSRLRFAVNQHEPFVFKCIKRISRLIVGRNTLLTVADAFANLAAEEAKPTSASQVPDTTPPGEPSKTRRWQSSRH